MIYKAANYTKAPPTVWLEPLADGTTNVWMTRNTTQREINRWRGTWTEAPRSAPRMNRIRRFNTPNASGNQEIAQNADSWWTFAEAGSDSR